MNLLVPNLPHQLSFSKSLSTSQCSFFPSNNKMLQLYEKNTYFSTVIRMGGGPRTYPGGVSKWQWKRMQAKKAKQLLKARLCRERQIYEMRKRAELKAAVSELERPWEVVENAPNLFSVSADEQLKVLADRFQKPGGFDLWSEKDGPQLFETPDELPSARFFPKGVVHSIKPYRRIGSDELEEGDGGFEDGSDLDSGVSFDGKSSRKGDGRTLLLKDVDESESDDEESSSPGLNSRMKGMDFNGNLSKKGNGRRFMSDDVDEFESDDGECSSSALSSRKKGMDFNGNSSKKGNGRRFSSEDVYVSESDDGDSYSYPLNSGSNRVNVNGRMRNNGNGRKYFAKGDDGSDDGERSLGSRRNAASFEGRTRTKGIERGNVSKGVDRSYGSYDSRSRRNGNGRRFMPKDADDSNGSYSEGVGSVRRQRGTNSFAGRSGGKYTRRSANYASPRVRDADSEVYDMGLQRDGSYGFVQKSQQSESTSW